MKFILRLAVLGTLGLVGTGCSNSTDLPGTWSTSVTSSQSYTFNETMVLNSDKTGSITFTATGNCTGSQNTTGITWDASSNTITFAGSSRCTSTVMCTPSGGTATAVDCASIAPYYVVGACNYSLSNSNNTLTISNCSRAPLAAATFTRASGPAL